MKSYKLKEVARIYSGATPLTNKKAYYADGDIPWITPKDLSGYGHKYISSGRRSITKEGFDSCAANLLPAGTVLFSSRAPIGYVAIAGQALCTNQGFKSFVCDERLLFNQYLYYYLIKNREQLEALGNGSTFKEISRNTIAEYRIELPSVEEQHDAVKELIKLDERYDHNCSILGMLEELMECIYCSFYENREIPYKDVDLGSIVDIITGGTPSTKNESYWSNGIYFWYTPSDVTLNSGMISYGTRNRISVSGLTNSSAKLIPARAILMTSRATIGEATINMTEATTNQGMLAMVPKDERFGTLQLYFWLKRNKRKIASIANGSIFKEIYKKDLEKLPVSVNNESCKAFEEKTANLFSLYESLVKEKTIILALKQCMMELRF